MADGAPNEWSKGICDCCDDCNIALCSFLLPCYQFGKNAEAVGDDCCITALLGLVPFVNIFCRVTQRGKIRETRNIDGDCCSDVLYTVGCPCCSLAQEGQECALISDATAIGEAVAEEVIRSP